MFFLIRTSAGREAKVAEMIFVRTIASGADVYSVIAPAELKGYVFVEASSYSPVEEITQALNYVKSVVHGVVPREQILPYFGEIRVIESLESGDIIEIKAGVFRRMRAKILEIDLPRNEATIELEDGGPHFPITISADYLKLVEKTKK